jgi:probable DNA metabolism protein
LTRAIALPRLGTVAAWRDAARGLASQGVPSCAVTWAVGPAVPGLFDGLDSTPIDAVVLRLPRAALVSIELALCHSDPQRFTRAYDMILRLSRGVLRWGDRSDPAMHKLLAQEKAVRRDIHKMHAFVRFREVTGQGATRRAFVAWFEPDHFITQTASPFFARRFGDMDWVIATPDLTARFVGGTLTHEVTGDVAPPPTDATEDLWRTYYANIFNPARLMVSAMTSEMPRKYWKNLPEADLIPDLIRTAPARARAMEAARPTLPPAHLAKILRKVPTAASASGFTSLQYDLNTCRRCPIGHCATQGVAGIGPQDAALMIVGEQPGDAEDLAGRPFVGPAGQMLQACAAQAGLALDRAYLTNAVKHFKFQVRGKRRIHQRPTTAEVLTCRWWLDLERATVQPQVILAMGASATLAVTGKGTDITARRGMVERGLCGTRVLITTHPAYILRLTDTAQKAQAMALFTEDLRHAAGLVRPSPKPDPDA